MTLCPVMIEEWRDVPGYEGLYQISNLGIVRNRLGHVISPSKNKCRWKYLQVGLCKNGIRKYFRVHRLVWSAFNGSIPDKMEVNHVDQNPENNRLDNLNILTHAENLRWGDGVQKRAEKNCKKVYQYTVSGGLVHVWESLKSIGEKTEWNSGTIANYIRMNKTENSTGFVWSYVEL